MLGISVRHGPHHVAQKLMTTGRPRNCDRVASPPWSSASRKSGAARRTSAVCACATRAARASSTRRTRVGDGKGAKVTELAARGATTQMVDLAALPADPLLGRGTSGPVTAALEAATRARIIVAGTPV